MSEITIKTCTVADVITAPNYETLIDAYALESAINGIPDPRPNIDLYRVMETAGLLTVLSAFDADKLVGLLAMNVSIVPQYGLNMGAIVVFYVDDEHRKQGTGLHLVKHAEDIAREKGAAVLLMGAPADGRLAKAARMMGFTASHISFSKVL
jgi:GNAT superfamily N-acetyltransferase